MIEFTCPKCGGHNEMEHSSLDYASGCDVRVRCGKCASDILIDIYAVPVAANERLAPAEGGA